MAIRKSNQKKYSSRVKSGIKNYQDRSKNNQQSGFSYLSKLGKYYNKKLSEFYEEYLEIYYELLKVMEYADQLQSNDILSQLSIVSSNNYSDINTILNNLGNNSTINLATLLGIGDSNEFISKTLDDLLTKYESIYSDLFEVMNDIMDLGEAVSMDMGNTTVIHQLGLFQGKTELFGQFFADEQTWSNLRHNRDFMKITMTQQVTKTKLENEFYKNGKQKYAYEKQYDENGLPIFNLGLGTRTDLHRQSLITLLKQQDPQHSIFLDSDSYQAQQMLFKQIYDLKLKTTSGDRAGTGRLNESMMKAVLEAGGIGDSLNIINKLNGSNISLDNIAWWLAGDQNFNIRLDQEIEKQINLSQKSLTFKGERAKDQYGLSGFGMSVTSYQTLQDITTFMQSPDKMQEKYDNIIQATGYEMINNGQTLDLSSNSSSLSSFIAENGGEQAVNDVVYMLASMFTGNPDVYTWVSDE